MGYQPAISQTNNPSGKLNFTYIHDKFTAMLSLKCIIFEVLFVFFISWRDTKIQINDQMCTNIIIEAKTNLPRALTYRRLALLVKVPSEKIETSNGSLCYQGPNPRNSRQNIYTKREWYCKLVPFPRQIGPFSKKATHSLSTDLSCFMLQKQTRCC